MYQADNLRSGPMGSIIIAIRAKFLVFGQITLSEPERTLLLTLIDDIFITSKSAIVQSQFGTTLKFLRPDVKPRTVSQINQDPADLAGTYQTEWEVMTSLMTKLGKADPPPYQPLKQGPDGDPFGISTPAHHDINDGTGNNHR